MRLLKLVAVSLLVAPIPFVACASSTAASIELWTDIPCEKLVGFADTGITSSVFVGTDLTGTQDRAHRPSEVPERVVGADSLEYRCPAGGAGASNKFYKLGDVTLYPKNLDNTRVAVVVTANRGATTPGNCRTDASLAVANSSKPAGEQLAVSAGAGDCMEVAATFDYRANETRRVIVRLTQTCLGKFCEPGSTCVNSQCTTPAASFEVPGVVPPIVPTDPPGPTKDAATPADDSGPIRIDSGVTDGGQLSDAPVDTALSKVSCSGTVPYIRDRGDCSERAVCVDPVSKTAGCFATTNCAKLEPGAPQGVCCVKAAGCCLTVIGSDMLPLTGKPCATESGGNPNSPLACFQPSDCAPGQICHLVGTRGFGSCGKNFVPLPPQEAGVGIDPDIIIVGVN
jgi:hypothetical protein